MRPSIPSNAVVLFWGKWFNLAVGHGTRIPWLTYEAWCRSNSLPGLLGRPLNDPSPLQLMRRCLSGVGRIEETDDFGDEAFGNGAFRG